MGKWFRGVKKSFGESIKRARKKNNIRDKTSRKTICTDIGTIRLTIKKGI